MERMPIHADHRFSRLQQGKGNTDRGNNGKIKNPIHYPLNQAIGSLWNTHNDCTLLRGRDKSMYSLHGESVKHPSFTYENSCLTKDISI
uniref:Uncharacterized protein n=1 Tax=Megaselia scalaris TaxID=36166 RepID=T1GSD1_MEGSC